ncbi:MFS transporter [Actinopolymorpha sp. B17G11]|uniref:MFS transporter n=1 Tax=unclassified Actinopolymorpha TaxID=2627063 RepID=UPI0032D9180A
MEPDDRQRRPGGDPVGGDAHPGRPLGPPGRRAAARRNAGRGPLLSGGSTANDPTRQVVHADAPTVRRPRPGRGDPDAPTERRSRRSAAGGSDAPAQRRTSRLSAGDPDAPTERHPGSRGDPDAPTEYRARARPDDPTVVRTAVGPTGWFAQAGHSVATGTSGVGRVVSRGASAVVGGVRRVTHAQGMGESGLAKLIELNSVHAGGDAAMAIGLAGTLFFAVPVGEARGRVALYLLVTMAPFVLIAPLIGPFLDRFRRGRRWALGSTMAIRAFFCWVMAGGVATGELWLYPLVFGCLVASKAHNVSRAAAVPRLLPPDVALVTANSRISLGGAIFAGIAAAGAGGLAFFGPAWPLRLAFLIFTVGTLMAILLPPRVDSAEGEGHLRFAEIGRMLRSRRVPTVVVLALRANAAFRAFTGFLLIFMAFLLREFPLVGYPVTLQVAVIAGAAGAGNLCGTALGALARARRSEIVIRVLLGTAALAACLTAIVYGLATVAVLAFVAGFAQQVGKLSLDALIQSEVPEHVRTSVFARSETLLQLSWVIGGGLGIVLPLIPGLGLGLCAFGLAVGLVVAWGPASKREPERVPQPAEPPAR